MKTEELDPRDIRPLHAVEDAERYNAIVEAMWRSGWKGRPVLVVETADGFQALTGSHRLAAAKCTETLVPCYVTRMSAEQLDRATAEFQDTRMAVIREAGDADAIALFELELEEGR